MTIEKIGRLLVLPLTVALLSGCPFAPKKDTRVTPPPPDPYLEQTSPANVLHNLIKAYQERTITEYEKLFDRTEFFFEFSQYDRDRDPTLPLGWDYVTDQASSKNMFEDDIIDKIVLRFNRSEAVAATPEDQLPGGPEGVYKVQAQSVHLEVHTKNDLNEPTEYLVDGDGADFFFRKYPEELAPSGLAIWRIVRWRDKPIGLAFSVGELKNRMAL